MTCHTGETGVVVFLPSSVLMQRRLKKEKRARRKLQEALDFESRRREQVELKQSDCLTGEHTRVIIRVTASMPLQFHQKSE